MIKRIFKTSFYSIVSRFFITTTNLAVVFFIAKHLGKQDLGIYGIAFFFYQFFNSFSSMGIPVFIGKEVASQRENKDKVIDIFNEFLSANFYGLLSSLPIILLFLFFYHKISLNLLLLSFIAGFLLGLERNLSGFLLGKELMLYESVVNGVEFLIIILSLFLISPEIFSNVELIFILRIIALLIGVFLRLIFLRDCLALKTIRFKLKHFSEIKFYWMSALSYLFFRQIDIFILSFLFAKSVIGDYFLSIRIFYAVAILAEVISLALTPFISRIYNNKENIEFKNFRNSLFVFSLLMGMFLGVFLYVFRDFLISIFNRAMIENCSYYLAILSIAIPFRFSIYILGSMMSSSKFQNIRLYINLAGAILFILIIFTLVKLFSINGAIYSKIITEIFLFSSYFYFVFFKMKKEKR